MYKNIDFLSFQKLFSTEKKCWKFLFRKRWPNGFVCPRCSEKHYYFIHTRKIWQCKRCKYQCSVTAGTIFHNTRTSLTKLFWLVFFIAHDKNGHSALDITRKLSISYKVAWSWAHKIRFAMMQQNANYKLAGLLELDDSYFGSKNVPGKRGRGAGKKTAVLVAAQLTEKQRPLYASMTVVKNMEKNTIRESVNSNIEKGAVIKTDAYSSFKFLKNEYYSHLSYRLYDPADAPKVLPWVHIFITNAKSMIRGTYKGVGSKYLQRYLSEFCYRLNRRFNVDNIFDRLIATCIYTNPITIAELRV